MNSEVDKYNDLIIRFLNKETLPYEDEILMKWKCSSHENEIFFNKIRDTWFASSQLKQPSVFNEDKALAILHNKMELPVTDDEKPVRRIITFQNLLKIAAVLIGVFALGGVTSYWVLGGKKVAESQFVRVVAPKGSRSFVYLPDGSRVWLNAGSEVVYTAGSESRNVKLVGEAFFKVKSNPEYPFIVTANGIAIKAVGTSFNVKAYPEEKKVITTLVEGIVKIERPGTSGEPVEITMRPNQKVVVFNDSSLFVKEKAVIQNRLQESGLIAVNEKELPAIQETVNTELYTSWKDERWIIDGEEFGNLATLLERRYNVSIHFQNNELKSYRFSGTFTNETVEQALVLMRYTLPFDYDIEKNKIILKTDPLLMKSYNQAYQKRN